MTILQLTNVAKTRHSHGTSEDLLHRAQRLHLLASFLVWCLDARLRGIQNDWD
jgi:hypothetical protein